MAALSRVPDGPRVNVPVPVHHRFGVVLALRHRESPHKPLHRQNEAPCILKEKGVTGIRVKDQRGMGNGGRIEPVVGRRLQLIHRAALITAAAMAPAPPGASGAGASLGAPGGNSGTWPERGPPDGSWWRGRSTILTTSGPPPWCSLDSRSPTASP